jgi:2,3-bisphosphoglycerate-dependent phosphoglycerate mutase
MYLEKLSPEEIVKTEIPTGVPKYYNLDKDLNILEKKYL